MSSPPPPSEDNGREPAAARAEAPDAAQTRRPRWLVVRKSALEAGTFAGRGAMWTSMRQRDDMLADYEPQAGLEDLVILKRKDSH